MFFTGCESDNKPIRTWMWLVGQTLCAATVSVEEQLILVFDVCSLFFLQLQLT